MAWGWVYLCFGLSAYKREISIASSIVKEKFGWISRSV